VRRVIVGCVVPAIMLRRFARVARLLHGVKRAAGLWETRDARQ
jgi:hypothetical protein